VPMTGCYSGLREHACAASHDNVMARDVERLRAVRSPHTAPAAAQPAREADFLARVGLVSLLGIDDPKTARRRLDGVQDHADLHTRMVRGPAAGNISRLADACQAGAAAP
jgi:hypothetical protein